ncbi:MAG: hypothetical protein ACFE0J_00095 [Elainellaceae cyanobacterium]
MQRICLAGLSVIALLTWFDPPKHAIALQLLNDQRDEVLEHLHHLRSRQREEY